MGQTRSHATILATGALVAACCLTGAACSKPGAAVTTTTTVAKAQPQPQPVLVAPPAPAINPTSDLSQTAAVSPPGAANGALPPTPGEREAVGSVATGSPR